MKMARITNLTNSLSPRLIVSIIGLFVLLLIISLAGATRPSLASASAQDTQASKAGQELVRPTTPLESLLNKDGTLKLDTGFSGSLDPSGWRMATGPNGKPRFMRA